MKILLSKESLASVATDLLVVCVSGPKPAQDAHVKALDRALGGMLTRYIRDQAFKATPGARLSLPGAGVVGAKRILLLGGKAPFSAIECKTLAVRAARAAHDRANMVFVAPAVNREALEAIGEGLTTGAYRYVEYFTGDQRPKRLLGRVTVISSSVDAGKRKALAAGVVIGESVNLARDLVNCPPNVLTATELAERARTAARREGLQCKIFDKRGVERLNMQLLLAVNRGSAEEPRFIHMTYKPKRAAGKPRRVVFVGKGLTFDAGGLCIKPSASMLDMKSDMAGGAVTIATVLAAARLQLPVEVHGVVGSTDNMTGGAAYRPGDVFPSRQGKTVEIHNTDAEGRLVLADALDYACELEPDYLIDHATLTGASMVALGNYRAALFANDDKLRRKYEAAADASGEAFWNMPLDEELRDQLKSAIADLKHIGGRFGGTITAALFLQEFVGKSKWVHLDIAGPAFLEGAHGIMPRGGTGFGVATAVRFLEALQPR